MTSTTAMHTKEAVAQPRPTGRMAKFVQDLLLTLPFVVLYLIQLAHHQMWRDELNAFGIAASSRSLPQLLHYVHYEGHPWLWYVMLWIVSRITVFPVGMRVLQGCIGVAIYWLIGVRSPFSRTEKVLLFLCYFVSFEYTVISRMYGVMLLLALLYIRRRALQPTATVGNAVLLGLLASSDVMGLLLAVGLGCEFVLSEARRRMTHADDGGVLRRRLALGTTVYFSLLVVSVLSLLPAHDISTRTTGHMFAGAATRARIVESVVDYAILPYFPTVTGIKGLYWGAMSGPGWRYYQIGVVLLFAIYWYVLHRHRNLLVLVGSTILMAAVFADLFYMGSTRHFGVTFVAFLLALWMLRSAGERLPWVVYPLLILTALGGVDAGIEAWQRPFSNAQATAGYLEQHQLQNLPLVGTPDASVAGVAELLHRPIYMLDCSCEDTFLLFSKRRDSFTKEQIPARLSVAEQTLHADRIVLLQTDPISTSEHAGIEADGFSITPLAQFTGAEAGHEDYYIFQLNTEPRNVHTARLDP